MSLAVLFLLKLLHNRQHYKEKNYYFKYHQVSDQPQPVFKPRLKLRRKHGCFLQLKLTQPANKPIFLFEVISFINVDCWQADSKQNSSEVQINEHHISNKHFPNILFSQPMWQFFHLWHVSVGLSLSRYWNFPIT